MDHLTQHHISDTLMTVDLVTQRLIPDMLMTMDHLTQHNISDTLMTVDLVTQRHIPDMLMTMDHLTQHHISDTLMTAYQVTECHIPDMLMTMEQLTQHRILGNLNLHHHCCLTHTTCITNLSVDVTDACSLLSDEKLLAWIQEAAGSSYWIKLHYNSTFKIVRFWR
jgi:hypothetical protein